MFAGCLRWDDICSLTPADFTCTDQCLLLFIRKRKNDQHKHGQRVPLAATGTVLCPVRSFRKFCALASITLPSYDSAQPFFRNISGHSFNSKPLSYSNHLSLVRGCVSRHSSIDPTSIGLHSFRSGGASALIENGVDPNAIREFGGWEIRTFNGSLSAAFHHD